MQRWCKCWFKSAIVEFSNKNHSIETLHTQQLYTEATANCVAKGGLFTPLLVLGRDKQTLDLTFLPLLSQSIDNDGHQPVLNAMRHNLTRGTPQTHGSGFSVWTGVRRINETHFSDGNGTWIHIDQISNLHRSCSTTKCALKYTLYANLKKGRLVWSNEISRAGSSVRFNHFCFL